MNQEEGSHYWAAGCVCGAVIRNGRGGSNRSRPLRQRNDSNQINPERQRGGGGRGGNQSNPHCVRGWVGGGGLRYRPKLIHPGILNSGSIFRDSHLYGGYSIFGKSFLRGDLLYTDNHLPYLKPPSRMELPTTPATCSVATWRI